MDEDGGELDADATPSVTTARNVAAGLLMRRRVDGADSERFRRVLSFRCFGYQQLGAAPASAFERYSQMLDAMRRVGFLVGSRRRARRAWCQAAASLSALVAQTSEEAFDVVLRRDEAPPKMLLEVRCWFSVCARAFFVNSQFELSQALAATDVASRLRVRGRRHCVEGTCLRATIAAHLRI